jgi:hypothetical protein
MITDVSLRRLYLIFNRLLSFALVVAGVRRDGAASGPPAQPGVAGTAETIVNLTKPASVASGQPGTRPGTGANARANPVGMARGPGVSLARRMFDVTDVTEILVHWYAGRSQSEIATSLGVDRKTIRKAPEGLVDGVAWSTASANSAIELNSRL